MQHDAVLEQHPDRLVAFECEFVAITASEPGRARPRAAALGQDEDLAHGDRPAVEVTVGQGPVGNELELPRRGDAEGMADGGLDHRPGRRQELVQQRQAGRRQLAVLVAAVEIVALREAGADIAHGEVLAPHLDARRGEHGLEQALGETLVQREDHHPDLGERTIVAAQLVGQRFPGFARPNRAIAAELLEGGVIVGALRLPSMHPLRQRMIRQAQELRPHDAKVALLALACHRHAAFFSTMSMTRGAQRLSTGCHAES
jgi:hypothetical protein